MILIKRPIRYWVTNRPAKGVKHKYRLLDIMGNRTCNATYKGVPYIPTHRETPYWGYLGGYGLRSYLADGWRIVSPPLGLPQGV